MRITITGTPGTGKTSVARALSQKLGVPLYSLSEIVEKHGLFSSYDEKREAYIVDIEKLINFFSDKKHFIAEGLVAHHIPSDLCIVLRASPTEIEKRLKTRNYSKEKVKENVESELLAVIATEAFQEPKAPTVCQIDTTDRTIEEVVELVERCIKGKRIVEDVDWLEEQEHSNKSTESL